MNVYMNVYSMKHERYSMKHERLYRDVSTLMEKPLGLCFLATTKLAHFAFNMNVYSMKREN